MKAHWKAIFASYPEIIFLQGGGTGIIMFAVTLLKPNVALAGIIAVSAAYLFSRFAKMDAEFISSGFYTYNPLLVGLSLGHLFRVTPVTVFFIVSAGIFSFMVTLLMANVLRTYLKLPILSLPFVVVSSIAYLASLRYSNLVVSVPETNALLVADLGLPLWLAGFFKSVGAILFTPSVLVGMVFCLLMLCSSRILVLLAVLGYYSGTTIRALMLGSTAQAFGDVNSFNFVLIAMAVGGVFLVPSVNSYLMAVLAVAVSTLVLDAITVFWSTYGIPAFTLPFNLISLGVIYALGLMRYPMLPTRLGQTPEETLENHVADRFRYPGQARTLFLPFSGAWTVWQAFDGKWTHKGNWRCAYDFVITDDNGNTCKGAGNKPADYYAYGKPVLSPVRGRIVAASDTLPDSPIGAPEKARNWGNYIIIQEPRGFHVEISHFAPESLRVKVGEWVERGAVLGLCGNSGYSPQPHIHVQVQLSDRVGAATVPFSFVSYSDGVQYHANDLPEEGAAVEPLYVDKRLDALTNFVLDDVHRFQVHRAGKPAGELRLTVRMAADGTFFLDSGRGRLFFGKHEGTFYCYRMEGRDEALAAMFLALPRMPVGYRNGLWWCDCVPVSLATTGLRRVVARFMGSFEPRFAKVDARQEFSGRNAVTTVVRSDRLRVDIKAMAELDERSGLAVFSAGDLEVRRIG